MQSNTKRAPAILPAMPEKETEDENGVTEPQTSSMTTPEVQGPMQPKPGHPPGANGLTTIPVEFAGMTAAQIQDQIKAMQVIKASVAEAERLKKKATPRGRGVMDGIKKAVYEDPVRKGDELLEYLRAKGVHTTRPSLDTMRSDFLHSLRVLKDLGALTEEAAKKI